MTPKYKNFIRTTIRIDPKTIDAIKRRAERNGRSFNKQVETMLNDRVGARDNDPLIIHSNNTYLWINPNGSYGELTPDIYSRFCKTGGFPLHGDEWKDVFDTIPDMVEAMGVAVCKWTDVGILVLDPDEYINLHTQFRKAK